MSEDKNTEKKVAKLEKEVRKLKGERKNNWRFELILVILGIIGAFFAADHGARVGAQTAFNLTEPYLIPNDVALDIFLKDSDIINVQYLESENVSEYLDVCIKNYGRISTGNLYRTYYSNLTIPCTGNIKNIEDIINIEAGNTDCARICMQSRDYINYKTKVTPGPYNLTLEIDCDKCKRTFPTTFKICVYREDPGKECPKFRTG